MKNTVHLLADLKSELDERDAKIKELQSVANELKPYLTLMQTIMVNVDNAELSDEDFRKFIGTSIKTLL